MVEWTVTVRKGRARYGTVLVAINSSCEYCTVGCFRELGGAQQLG